MGFSLIPLSTEPADARKKPPKKSSWKRYQFKGTTLEQVQEWGERYPGCGWAVLLGQPSGIVALDIDSDDGLEWVEMQGGFGPNPISFTSLTVAWMIASCLASSLYRMAL